MSLKLEEFKRYVEEYERDWELVEDVYIKALKLLEDVRENVDLINENRVRRVIRPFLAAWGIRAPPKDFNVKLAQMIRQLKDEFQLIRDKTIRNIDLNDEKFKSAIQKIFAILCDVPYVGATSASKIAHLLNPELFVMWDRNIMKKYNLKGSAEGYLTFLKRAQEEAKSIPEEFIEDISKRYGKTLAKLIDEFNWARTRGWW